MAAVIETERRGAVLVICMSDPDRLNSYDGKAMKELAGAAQRFDADHHLRAAVLTGEGENFCAGADVASVAAGGFDDPPYPELAEGLSTKPMVSAIEGICVGGGMMIACGTDLRIAGTGATFGLPEARWNYPAQWLGALARQILPAHAMELALLADERLRAERLLEMGWLNRVVADGTALENALGWADRLARLAPRALRHFKELLRTGSWDSPESALALGHQHSRDLIKMADTIEGGSAFAERRSPKFEDH